MSDDEAIADSSSPFINPLHNQLIEFLKEGGEPRIKVTGNATYLHESFTSCFSVYYIEITFNNHTLTIYRRYRQFVSLAASICLQWPKLVFQGFPKNKLIQFRSNVVDKSIVATRSVQLQKFLGSLHNHPFIFEHKIFLDWIDPEMNPKGYDLTRIRYQGTLEKLRKSSRHNAPSWKEYHCVLVKDILACYKTKDTNQVPIDVIQLKGAKVQPNDRTIPLCFAISFFTSPPITFKASSKRSFIKWIELLHLAAIPPNSKFKRVGSEAYIPDAEEKQAQENETKSIAEAKLKEAENLLLRNQKVSTSSSLCKENSKRIRRSTSFIQGISPPSSAALRSESDMNVTSRKNFGSLTTDLSTAEMIVQLKDDVDGDLETYLAQMETQISKLRFLGEETSFDEQGNKVPHCIELCQELTNIAIEFLETSVHDLCLGDTCQKFVQRVQELTSIHKEPFEKKFITSLLYILSPISRLVLFEKEEKRLSSLPSKLETTPKKHRKELSNTNVNTEKERLQSAISEATRFLFAALGISLIDSIKAQSAPILSPVVDKKSKFNSPRSPRRKIISVPSASKLNRNNKLLSRIQSFTLPEGVDAISSEKKEQLVGESVQIVDIACAICSERFLFHRIYNHASYCQKASKACGYSPGGFTNNIELNWNEKLQKLDKIILDRINELYELKDDQTESISTLLSVHKTITKILGNEINSKQAHEILSTILIILASWKNKENGSIFAYTLMVYKVLQQKFKSLILDSPSTSVKDKSTVNQENISKPQSQGISITDFEVIKRISRGAFGRVDLVRRKGTGEIYALKTMNKDDMVAKNLVNQVMIERQILSAMEKHEFVVRMHYAFHDASRLFLVMEYLPGGDCSALLQNIGYFDEIMAKYYIAETIMALDYLHSKNIIHRDVKPDNLLISATGHIKLTDFGLSMFGLLERHQDGDDISSYKTKHGHRVVGTPDYLPPEALLGTGGGQPTIDWWSVGVTLFEFLTGIPPFNDTSPERIFDNILMGDIPWPEVPEEMSEVAQDIIAKLLNPNPEKRLGAGGVDEIKNHPFFENIDWDNLYHQSRESIFIPRLDNQVDTGYFIRSQQGDSFISGEIELDPSEKINEELFAGYSWVDINANNIPNVLSKDIMDDDSSTELDEEIERAALELQETSSDNIIN